MGEETGEGGNRAELASREQELERALNSAGGPASKEKRRRVGECPFCPIGEASERGIIEVFNTDTENRTYECGVKQTCAMTKVYEVELAMYMLPRGEERFG
jgi:hypothetical protein